MRYTISDMLRPPPHSFYGDSYTRGKSPWHASTFPAELAHAAPEQGQHVSGWYLLDYWKNEVGFYPDGSTIEVDVRQLRTFPPDLRDELMRQGAETVLAAEAARGEK